jgi:adhesin transport system outer membrane protein
MNSGRREQSSVGETDAGPSALALHAVIGAAIALFAAAVAAQTAAPAAAGSFQTFSLPQAISQAMLRNPVRARAGHDLATAGFERDAAQWGRFPTLSVNAFARQSGGPASPDIVRLEQPLWAGGRIDGQIDSARFLLNAAESAEADINQRLMEQTSVTYIAWLDAVERLDIALKGAELFQGLLRYVRQREAQGLATAADVAIGNARHSTTLAQVSELRGALERARSDLAALTLVSSFTRGVPVSVPAYTDDDAARTERLYVEKSQLVAQRRAEVESARAQIDVARARLLPSLALRLEHLSAPSGTPQVAANESRAMFVLQYTPEAGLASYSGTQAARSRLEAAIAQLETVENDVRQRARSNLADYTASRAQVGQIEVQVTAIDAAAASYSRQFEAGRKTWLDVLNTHRELVEARLAVSRLRSARDQFALRLMVNTGGFPQWLETLPK